MRRQGRTQRRGDAIRGASRKEGERRLIKLIEMLRSYGFKVIDREL
jgi:hypothetical protein